MPTDEIAKAFELAETARRILSAHIRTLDGCCRGCFVQNGALIPHPCNQVEWAAQVEGHQMTVRYLFS